jgi:VCBS repeat-containing protein
VTSGAAGQDHDASGSPFSVSGIAAGDLTSANGGLDTTVHGQYGNLVMHADGTYTYDIDANAAATIALNNGSAAFGKDVFTYTITNDVGQSSSATLTVDVSNANNTVVLGGQGNNALSGHGSSDYGHADVFKWSLADAGEAGKAAVDTITNFNNASASSGGDVLDLRDLLQGETSANLTNYLHFEKSGADTIVHVSSNGGFASGYQPGAEDQKIIVTGFDLTAGHTSDATVIANLMAQSKLLVDH